MPSTCLTGTLADGFDLSISHQPLERCETPPLESALPGDYVNRFHALENSSPQSIFLKPASHARVILPAIRIRAFSDITLGLKWKSTEPGISTMPPSSTNISFLTAAIITKTSRGRAAAMVTSQTGISQHKNIIQAAILDNLTIK